MQEEVLNWAQNAIRCGNDRREISGDLTSNLRVGGSNPSERANKSLIRRIFQLRKPQDKSSRLLKEPPRNHVKAFLLDWSGTQLKYRPMPRRRKPRISAERGSGEPTVFNSDARTKIEKAYGQKLPEGIWEQIETATSLLTIAEPALKSAAFAIEFSKKLHAFTSAAQSLRVAIGGASPRRSKLSLQAMYEQFLLLQAAQTLSEDLLFPFFLDLLDGALALSDFTEEALKTESALSFSEFFMWDLWIVKLTEIAERHDLPFAARKDSTNKRKPGVRIPFVNFVRELQKYIPDECRRKPKEPSKTKLSDDALAHLISRARQRFRAMRR